MNTLPTVDPLATAAADLERPKTYAPVSSIEDRSKHHLRVVNCQRVAKYYQQFDETTQQTYLSLGAERLAKLEGQVAIWIERGLKTPPNYPLKIAPWSESVGEYARDCFERAQTKAGMCFGPAFVDGITKLTRQAYRYGFPEGLHSREKRRYVEFAVINKLRDEASLSTLMGDSQKMVAWLQVEKENFSKLQLGLGHKIHFDGDLLAKYRRDRGHPKNPEVLPENQNQIEDDQAGREELHGIIRDFWTKQSSEGEPAGAGRTDLAFLRAHFSVGEPSTREERNQQDLMLAGRFIDEINLEPSLRDQLKASLVQWAPKKERLLNEHLLGEMQSLGMTPREICSCTGLDIFDSPVLGFGDRTALYHLEVATENAAQLLMLTEEPGREAPGIDGS